MSRTRTQGSFTRPFTGTIETYRCDGVHQYGSSVTSLVETGSVKTTTDVVTPGYRAIIDNGGIINNPFFSQKIEKSGNCSGSRNVTWTPNCTGTGTKTTLLPGSTMNQGAPVFGAWNDAAQRNGALIEAATKALAGIAASDANLQVDLLEIHQTLSMVRHPLKELKKLLTNVSKTKAYRKAKAARQSEVSNGKKRRLIRDADVSLAARTRVTGLGQAQMFGSDKRAPSHVLGVGEFIENNWLQYRYGILPLMSSVQAIIKAASDVQQSLRHTSRASVSRRYDDLVATPVVNSGDAYSIVTDTGTKSGGISARAGVLYEFMPMWTDQLGFRWSDVTNTCWDVVPYSFVGDWFMNIGECIAALTPKANVRVLAQWLGYEEVVTIATASTAAPKTVTNFSITDSRKGRQTVVQTTKYRSPDPLQVGLVFRSLALNKPRDWNHLADGLTLFSGWLRR